ncbi:MAG: hypothetical protein P4M00_15805 [Azospirillaceae bacterium]|nr:hypothetical protein [Azospirillaceae bacterium]
MRADPVTLDGDAAVAAADDGTRNDRPDFLDTAVPPRGLPLAVLLLSLPLFGQIFHYMKDLPSLWALSKAFPILSLPLAFTLLVWNRAPITRQVVITFAWLVLAPSFVATVYFDQDFFTGVAAQVKLLPMLYFFSFLALLLYLRPTLRELATGYIVCGLLTYGALIILWALVPQSWYSGNYAFGSSPLFSFDNRGNRIRMPMYFGMITLFYGYRRFLRSRQVVWLLAAALGFVLTLFVVKTRAMMVGVAGMLVITTWGSASAVQRLVLLVLAPIGLAGLFSFGYLSTLFQTDATSGFDVRWTTVTKALDFLGTDWIRWLFGVGTISPINSDNLFAYFDHMFFLADITWLGILFEFGIIGTILILLYQIRGLFFYRRLEYLVDSDFLASLRDYILYTLLISGLYPPTLTPGEIAVILAIFAYTYQRLQTDGPA